MSVADGRPKKTKNKKNQQTQNKTKHTENQKERKTKPPPTEREREREDHSRSTAHQGQFVTESMSNAVLNIPCKINACPVTNSPAIYHFLH